MIGNLDQRSRYVFILLREKQKSFGSGLGQARHQGKPGRQQRGKTTLSVRGKYSRTWWCGREREILGKGTDLGIKNKHI